MPGLIRGVARTAVVAGTATAVSNRVSRRQANRWAAQEQPQQQQYQEPYPPQYQQGYPPQGYQQPQHYEEQVQYAPAPAAPASDDMDAKISQLKQLATLKDQGVLSEAEFEAEKAKLLR
jgi:hypothetical protein